MAPIRPVPDDADSGDRLQKLYRSATEAFDTGQWGTATVMGARALEALAESLVPDSSREDTLAAKLVESLEHRDLEQPVLTVAAALRRRHGLEAYLDGDEEDQEVAGTLLEILGCLIQYLRVLPDDIERLAARLGGDAGAPAGRDSG